MTNFGIIFIGGDNLKKIISLFLVFFKGLNISQKNKIIIISIALITPSLGAMVFFQPEAIYQFDLVKLMLIAIIYNFFYMLLISLFVIPFFLFFYSLKIPLFSFFRLIEKRRKKKLELKGIIFSEKEKIHNYILEKNIAYYERTIKLLQEEITGNEFNSNLFIIKPLFFVSLGYLIASAIFFSPFVNDITWTILDGQIYYSILHSATLISIVFCLVDYFNFDRLDERIKPD